MKAESKNWVPKETMIALLISLSNTSALSGSQSWIYV
jgi:hypothetical protein